MAIVEQFDLEEISNLNAIDASWFLPFLVHRLKPVAIERSVVAEISLRNLPDQDEAPRYLTLRWSKNNDTLSIPPVQESVITEWAAYGFACVVVPLYTRWQVLQVTSAGDGFDFWIGDGSTELGLEISGTLSGSLNLRQRSKIQQLLGSRHDVAGFVSVTRFRPLSSILSFHSKR